MPRPTGLAHIMADAALKLQRYGATRYHGDRAGLDDAALLRQQRDLSHCDYAWVVAGGRTRQSTELSGGCVAPVDGDRQWEPEWALDRCGGAACGVRCPDFGIGRGACRGRG